MLWGKVECNPARIEDPDGCSLLGLDRAAAAGRAMIAAAAELVEPAGPVDAARVKRVDLARDFEVGTAASFYVRALLGLKRPYARRSYIYSDPAKNRAETLWAGSKAGGCRLYDKHEAHGSRGAPEGSLRWEVEARADWLGRLGKIRTVKQLEAAHLEVVAENRWHWSRMGTEVMATDAVVERVLGAGLTPAVERGVLGHMLLQSHGVARPLAKGTAAKYDRVLRDLGITLDSGQERASCPGFAGRLDWDSGREVVRAA